MKKIILLVISLGFISLMVWSGTDTIAARSPGQVISSTHMNVIRNALTQVFYPRNSSGVVTDVAGDLGSSSYRWNDASIKRILLGDASSNIQLKDVSNVFQVLISGNIKTTVSSAGFDGQYVKAASVPRSAIVDPHNYTTFTASGTFTVPNGIKWVYADIQAAGGGGGGAASGASGNSVGGGGGGAGGQFISGIINVDGLSSVTVTVGSGGTAGVGATSSGNNGTAGGNGGYSSVAGNNTITAQGGTGGGAGLQASVGAGGAVNTTYKLYNANNANGGAGGISTGTTNATAGSDLTSNYAGGAAGSSASGYGAGGGGGSGYYGVGAAGGATVATGAGNAGGTAGNNTGGGAGGGANNGSGSFTAGNGGVGGSGKVVIYYP